MRAKVSGRELPYPFNSPWVRQTVTRYGLGVWFVCLAFGVVFGHALAGRLGIDARLYVMAARTAWT